MCIAVGEKKAPGSHSSRPDKCGEGNNTVLGVKEQSTEREAWSTENRFGLSEIIKNIYWFLLPFPVTKFPKLL